MKWDHAVSWGWGVWVSVSDIGRVGSDWPRQNRTRDAHKISPHGTMTKRPSYELGPAGVQGFGLALAILVGLGWVGLPELKQSPQATRGKKYISCAVN